MNSQTLLTGIVAAALFSMVSVSGQDQSRHWLEFNAVCKSPNNAGDMVTSVLTKRSLVRHCVLGRGMHRTNLPNHILVYEYNGDLNGDVIRVVNRNDGTVVCNPFRLLFQRSVADAEGRHVERLAFMFNEQNTEPIGSAIISERPEQRLDGSQSRTVISGRMQFFDEVYHSNRTAVCSGTFTIGRRVDLD